MLYTYTAADATVAQNGVIPFNDNGIATSPRITHAAGAGGIEIHRAGYYFIIFDGDAAPTAAGDVTIQMYVNGVAYPGAEARATSLGTTDVVNLDFATILRVNNNCPCFDDNLPTVITLRNLDGEAIFSNVGMTIFKVG